MPPIPHGINQRVTSPRTDPKPSVLSNPTLPPRPSLAVLTPALPSSPNRPPGLAATQLSTPVQQNSTSTSILDSVPLLGQTANLASAPLTLRLHLVVREIKVIESVYSLCDLSRILYGYLRPLFSNSRSPFLLGWEEQVRCACY